MPIDREATLRNAEKFLRVGRLDAAIGEYARVVEDQPRDLTTANTLGDLYLRAGQAERAVVLYQRIADTLLADGFYPKAGALLKKILKIRPDDEQALIHLGEIAARQGLVAEARGFYSTVGAKRSARGDVAGADEMVARLGALDPSDFDARLNGARALERRGDLAAAAVQYRELFNDLTAKGRTDEAAAVALDFARCSPDAIDASMLVPLIEADFKAGSTDSARARIQALTETHPEPQGALVDVAERLASSHAEAAGICLDGAVDHVLGAGDHQAAAVLLERFIAKVPGHLPALLRLVEIAVDGDLDAVVHTAQGKLADAYLQAGRAEEARVIAEDLVTRDRADTAHVERLRRALEMLGVEDIDRVIAERLSGPALDPLEFFEDEYTAPAPTSVEEEYDPVLAAILSLGQDGASSTPALPSMPVIEKRDPEVTAPPAPPPESPSRPAPSSVPEIDLTGLLLELKSAPKDPPVPAAPRELDDVFAGMRADAAADPEADESEDYVSLAQTYTEMGLRDEAISALLTAVKSPRNRFRCASMLAQLYRDNGDIPRAIEWYERAAQAPAATPEEGSRLMYDLADLLETVGENARALAVFMEIQAESGDFLDVEARIRRLSTDQVGG